MTSSHIGYIATAYGITILTIFVTVSHCLMRLRHARQTLKSLGEKGREDNLRDRHA